MKRKISLLLLMVIFTRFATLLFFKTDILFYLSPRNFNGRGLLATPIILDFLIPLLIIIFLFQKENFKNFRIKNIANTYVILLIIALPVLTGLILTKYIEEPFFIIDVSVYTFLRWLLFVLTFWAIHLFADNLTMKSKSLYNSILFIFIFFIAFLQDTIGKSGIMYIIFGLINSVGLSTALLAIASRKFYKKYPIETLIMAAITGVFINFFMFNAQSQSYFTIFLPMLAMYATAFGLYCNYNKTIKSIIISLPIFIALFLNFVLPSMLSMEVLNEITEQNISKKLFEEKVGDITVKYAEKRLRNISVKLARVIQAANEVSKENFGISPNVNQIIILGIAPGGFHGKYPQQIVGNIISEKYLTNCNDSLFLNNPDLPANFPDPVNGILHEYSHLFGAVPYIKWMPCSEEEGWATFSATKLSMLIYKKYGITLWKPGYNYAAQAKKITEQNLSGKAVAWSHPNEFGGFKLWYSLDKDFGTKTMYRKRWDNTYHNLLGSVLIESNPEKAKKLASAFGIEKFIKYGSLKPVTFGNIYSLDDYMTLSKLAGVKEETIKNLYSIMEYRKIDPSIPVP